VKQTSGGKKGILKLNFKSNQITFNEHVTNVHACSERGKWLDAIM